MVMKELWKETQNIGITDTEYFEKLLYSYSFILYILHYMYKDQF